MRSSSRVEVRELRAEDSEWMTRVGVEFALGSVLPTDRSLHRRATVARRFDRLLSPSELCRLRGNTTRQGGRPRIGLVWGDGLNPLNGSKERHVTDLVIDPGSDGRVEDCFAASLGSFDVTAEAEGIDVLRIEVPSVGPSAKACDASLRDLGWTPHYDLIRRDVREGLDDCQCIDTPQTMSRFAWQCLAEAIVNAAIPPVAFDVASEYVMNTFRRLSTPRRLSVVAVNGDDPRAHALCHLTEAKWRHGLDAHLADSFVPSHHRSEGWSTRLLQAIEFRLALKGVKRIESSIALIGTPDIERLRSNLTNAGWEVSARGWVKPISNDYRRAWADARSSYESRGWPSAT